MHVKVHCHGLESSPWMEEFIAKRVGKLDRYLSNASMILVSLRLEKGKYMTNLAIHDQHDYSFHADGDNFYESFATSIAKATRALRENKQKLKDRINRKYFSIRDIAV